MYKQFLIIIVFSFFTLSACSSDVDEMVDNSVIDDRDIVAELNEEFEDSEQPEEPVELVDEVIEEDSLFDLSEGVEIIDQKLDSSNITDFVSEKYKIAYWHNLRPLAGDRYYFYTLARLEKGEFEYYINFYLPVDDKHYFAEVLLEESEQDIEIADLNVVYKEELNADLFSEDMKERIEEAKEYFMDYEPLG